MSMRARQNRISKIEDNLRTSCFDLLIEEHSTTLFVDEKKIVSTVLSPGNEDLWALGYLRCCGMIETVEDVVHMKAGSTIQVVLKQRPAESLPQSDAGRRAADVQVSPDMIRTGISWLAEAPLYTATGAAHVAALISCDGKRLVCMEDIGRHNAIDKAIGWTVERRVDPASMILLTSGRMPEDIVQKVVTVGIPIMASVSAATAQGAELAEENGVTLVGFVRGRRMNIYTHPTRVK